MPFRVWLAAACALALTSSVSWSHDGEELPAGFIAETVVDGWNQPIDLAFLPDGRLLVAEKAGRVWMVEAGVQSAQPIVNLTAEVGDAGSRRLKSLAIDPNFLGNGFLYLFYEVDRHHLFFFGTPQYDPLVTDNVGPTVARITRVTLDPTNNFETLVPGSRFVLLGESASTGFPLIEGHQSGMLRFGVDGTLLASCGDGAGVPPDYGGGAENEQALLEGILTPREDVGSFRAQLLDSLSGKLVRIDPATGDGVASNPYFDPARPRSPRSRIWTSGFRNPFRFDVIPNSAPGPDHPGTILIGDVGRSNWEELNRSTQGAENFGWPLYEGMETLALFATVPTDNPSAPNPLFGQTLPGLGLCTQEFFTFQELLLQESLSAPSWPNPCDPLQQIPASVQPAMHTRPVIDWNHVGPSRSGGFDAQGNAITFNLDDAASPIAGPNFEGSCAMGGVWYEQGNYPSEFENAYLFTDFADNWIKHLRFDATGVPVEVADVGEAVGQVVAMAIDPISTDVYFLQLSVVPQLPGVLVHLAYYANNVPPSAIAQRAPVYGPSPLTVQFDATDSGDPEAMPLSFEWNFGDGTPLSALEAPLHIFPSEDVTSQGTVIAQVLDLVPPQIINLTTGFFPDVISDGFFVNPAAGVVAQTYVTFYDAGVDPDPEDWVGYAFGQNHLLHQLVFQEGAEFSDQGGWFEDLTVDVRVSGIWTEVSGLSVSPPFGAQNGVFYEIYELLFDPILGDAVRVRGLAGGTDAFVSVGELRAIAAPTPTGLPTRYDVSLLVRDDVNLTSQASTSIWIDNTPPSIALSSPLNGGTYDQNAPDLVNLGATVSDLESATPSLTCEWQVSLHHNDHAHPEPLITDCASSIVLGPHGTPDQIYYWEFTLTVTDPQGLPAKQTSLLYPESPSLVAASYAVSLFDGGTTFLTLNAGPSHANEIYWMFMSATGTFPGVNLSGVPVPLNFDPLFALTLKKPFLGLFTQFLGQLDANGAGNAAFRIPAGTDADLAGITVHFAYVSSTTLGSVDFASNPAPLTFNF